MRQLRQKYRRDRYAVLPQLVSRQNVQVLLSSIRNGAWKRVVCGENGVEWDQQTVDRHHMAYRLFDSPQCTRLVRMLSGVDRINGINCWASRYRVDEYIDSHRDADGSIQLVICLKAPPRVNGGVLVVEDTEIVLAPGDAIAFAATELQHRTTPLVASDEDKTPQRIVVVGRYFLD